MRTPKSPFKDLNKFKTEIASFLKKHKTVIGSHAKRISEYFEMSCYNSIVKFYENNGYNVTTVNLINNEFKYKLSPAGYPHNFSYFKITKRYNYKKSSKVFHFEIHHNLAVQSSVNKKLFVTPDTSIISQDSIKELKDPRYFFSGSRSYYYVPSDSLQTFCEVKNYNPFPELLFNFIGLLQELKHDLFLSNYSYKNPKHIAPAMMISGGGNYHSRLIKEDLTTRYKINIFFSLFYSRNKPYSQKKTSSVNKIGSRL